MNTINRININDLLQTENDQLNKLHAIVKDAMDEELLITHKLLEESASGSRTIGERLADRVAEFGGSWGFIIFFGFVLTLWIIANSFFLAQKAFDPYPYILMNLILSCVAALQAPVIMMSQNRQETKDRKRAENDYIINLKSELEIRSLHQKIDLSIVDQFKLLCDIQQKQIELLERIEAKLKDHTGGK
jgi:uncharacterized membrane protein